jgi:formylglycine-generating enzyme required for sulfatase activity
MANRYGLYDTAGNVFEWCNDWYDSAYYSYSPYDNPKGPSSSPSGYRVLRGGSWDHVELNLRCADRNGINPDARYDGIGFRLALKDS